MASVRNTVKFPLHKELVKSYADIKTCDHEQKSALHFAAKGGWTEAVKQLLKSGYGIVNMKDKDGRTALHEAVTHSMKRTVEILLQNDADVDALDGNDRSPLSYAAERGELKCARVLLNKNASLFMDKTLKQPTPVQFSARNGHSEVMKLLAEKQNENILARRGYRQMNCLDMAIEGHQKETVLTIIQSNQWEEVLRNCTGSFESPTRKLIRFMPDAAREVFNRCTDVKELSDEIEFIYEFLDDTMSLGSWNVEGTNNVTSPDIHFHTAEPDKAEPYTADSKLIRDNHPLMVMVKSGRKELLGHPLVTALLKKKWEAFRWFNLINILIYVLYLAMLTGFTLDIKAPFQFTNISADDEACSDENVTLYKIPKFAATAKYFVIILVVGELVKEILEMVLMFSCRFWLYFSTVKNILECITYILSIVSVVNMNDCEDTGYRTRWQWGCGTVSVFFAWISLFLFTKKYEFLGIYVVMFYRIVKVFLKFFCVFSLLIVAFSVSFHCLFQNQEQFGTFWTSFVKTTAMMIGELDFGSIFFDEHVHYGIISYLFICIFMLFMTIVAINLLIGLAVSNIQEFQEEAGLKKKEMQDGTERDLIRLQIKDLETSLKAKIKELDSKLTDVIQRSS